MADTKITALTALTAADPANDVIPIVDVSDTSMAASGTTKKISVNNILSSSPTASGALTVTGLVTAGSATISGNLTVQTNKLAVTSIGVGANYATPTQALSVGGAVDFKTYVSHMDNFAVYANATDGTTIASFTGYPINFRIANVEVGRINTTGNLVLKGGTTAANGVGVTFPAVQVASSDANCLDDYEEGTWTGTLIGSTTTPATPITKTGKYTKIGRQVSITIYFDNVDTTGYVGSVVIQGLPFTEDGSRASGSLACYNFDFNGGTSLFVNIGGSTLYCQTALTNSNWRDVLYGAGALRYLQANITYIVA